MIALDKAVPQRQGGATDRSHLQEIQRDRSPEHVDNRVHRADFMKMHIVDRLVMHRRLRLGEPGHDGMGALASAISGVQCVDDRANVPVSGVMVMRMAMVTMLVAMTVTVTVVVMVCLRMVMMMSMIMLSRPGMVGLAIGMHLQVDGADGVALGAGGGDAVGRVDGQGLECGGNLFDRCPQIDTGAEEHVAGQPGECINVKVVGHGQARGGRVKTRSFVSNQHKWW
jgi:hypothetical protein